MAGPGVTEWQTATNIGVATGLVVPLYEVGDVVYNALEIVQAAGANQDFPYNAYTVTESATMKQFDATGTPTWAKKDGVTAAAGATVAGTNGNNPLSDSDYPYFYVVTKTSTGKSSTIHESDLLTLAQAKTLVGTEVGNWT